MTLYNLKEIRKIPYLINEHYSLTLLELCGAILLLWVGLTGFLPLSSTPYLLIYGWLWLWLRRIGWYGVGLSKPKSWKKVILSSLIIGIGYQLVSLYMIEPLLRKITGQVPDMSIFGPLVGNIQYLFLALLASWSIAAFGEELVYRGYLLNFMARLTGKSTFSWILSTILSSILFGLAHQYQDLSGILTTTIHGLIFAGLYFHTGRNLWASILAHGIHDTFGFTLIYLGIYPGL